MIANRWIKGRETEKEISSPYEDIKISEDDLKNMSMLFWHSDIFEKLNDITEYRLALKVARGQMSKEAFEGAMLYWKYLKEYFNNK